MRVSIYSARSVSPRSSREDRRRRRGGRDATYQIFFPIRHQHHSLPAAHHLGRDIRRRTGRVVLRPLAQELIDGLARVEDDNRVAAEGEREDLAIFPRPFQNLQRSVDASDARRGSATVALGIERMSRGNVLWGEASSLGIEAGSQGWECRAGRVAISGATSENFAVCRLDKSRWRSARRPRESWRISSWS